MLNRNILLGLLFMVLFNLNAFATIYSVKAPLESGTMMTSRYHVVSTDIGYHEKSNTPYLVVYSEGDCRWQSVPKCRDVFAPDHSFLWRECWNESEQSCLSETGYYPLPKDQVQFDGDVRLKFVGNGKYETIARKDRLWFFPFVRQWHLKRQSCTISASEDLTEATLLVNIKD